MKRSELKEAIKAEITSVLSEEMTDKEREDKLQQAKRGGGKEKPLRKLAAIGKKEDKKNLKENDSTSVLQIIDILKQANLDGETLQYVLEEIGMDEQMWKQLNVTYGNPVSFSDVREGVWSTGTVFQIQNFLRDLKKIKTQYYDIVGSDDVFNGLDQAESAAEEMMMNAPENRSDITEDEEPTSAELKKKDSVATISNKLQKLTAKMKKKAKEFKEAEGKAKDKIKDELKDMTAEKKKLEKSL